MVIDVAVKDLNVVRLAGVMSLQQERVKAQLNEEAWRCSDEPRTIDSVRVDPWVLWGPE